MWLWVTFKILISFRGMSMPLFWQIHFRLSCVWAHVWSCDLKIDKNNMIFECEYARIIRLGDICCYILVVLHHLYHCVCVCVLYIYIYIYKIYKNNMVFKCKYVRINILSNISSVTFSNVIDGIMED